MGLTDRIAGVSGRPLPRAGVLLLAALGLYVPGLCVLPLLRLPGTLFGDGLAAALRRLATNPGLRAELAARARAARRAYCWQAQEGLLRDLYARILPAA